jgi:hypothetical protein
MGIAEAHKDEDVSTCSLPWGKLVTIGEVWDTTKDTQMSGRLALLSLSLLHVVGAQSLLVGLGVSSKPSQNFHKAK